MRCELCRRFAGPSGTCGPCAARVDRARTAILAGMIRTLAIQFAERDAQTSVPQSAVSQIKPSDVKDAPDPAKGGDTAVSGTEGVKAEQLLKAAKDRAVKTLASITKQAVLRLLADPRWVKSARDLYTPAERQQLEDLLAATSATANLLGRARVRGRVKANLSQFSEVWLQFADTPAIKPMAPEAAVAYFKGLQPGIDADPGRFGEDQRRRAFTLAGVTEENLLHKVKGIILDGMQSGESTTDLASRVGDVLRQAGVHPRNPQYAEMVVRTNLLDAYNQGQYDEANAPDMREFFPVWRYDAILDKRSRPEHAGRNGRYYPVSASFASVRGTRPADVCNCRCTMTPVNQFEWEDLQAAGARLEPGYGP